MNDLRRIEKEIQEKQRLVQFLDEIRLPHFLRIRIVQQRGC